MQQEDADATLVHALETRLLREIGQPIRTPIGPGTLSAVDAGVAVVRMENNEAVSFPVGELVPLHGERCALCYAPATQWCVACGQPVCHDHVNHGVAASPPTPYMVDKVVNRLTRYGQATVPESDLAYAAAAVVRSRRLGGVDIVEPAPGKKGLRLILRRGASSASRPV